MGVDSNLVTVVPVLPSQDIARDVAWYDANTGFTCLFADKMYAVLHRNGIYLHLQWHADTDDDPLLGGSVIRIFVRKIEPMVEEFIDRGTITYNQYSASTS